MEIGPFGGTGIAAVSRALVEHRADLELVPIHRQDTAAENARERAPTCAPAMNIHVQVIKFSLILALK